MPQPRHKAVIAGLAVTLTLGGVALPAVATTSDASTSDSDPNGMGNPAPADFDKADYYEGTERVSTFAMVRSASKLSPVTLTDEMKYFTKYESGCNYDKGLSYGDGYNAMGYYQFDRRYALMPFIQQVYSYNSTKYAMFKAVLAQREMLSNPAYNMYDYVTRQLTAPAQILNEAWHAAYAADPAEFSALQDAYAYNNYYLPVQSSLLNAYGVDVRNRADCVKGLVWGMCNLFGQGGVQKFFKGAKINNAMTDREIVEALCDTVIDKVDDWYPNQPQYWNGWKNRYKKEKAVCLDYLDKHGAEQNAGGQSQAPDVPNAENSPQEKPAPDNQGGAGSTGGGVIGGVAGGQTAAPGVGGTARPDGNQGAGSMGDQAGQGVQAPSENAPAPDAGAQGAPDKTPDAPAAPDASGDAAGQGEGTRPSDDAAPGPHEGGEGATAGPAEEGGATSGSTANPQPPVEQGGQNAASGDAEEPQKPQDADDTAGVVDKEPAESGKPVDTAQDDKKAERDPKRSAQAKASFATAADLPDTGDIAALVLTGATGLAVAGGSFLSLAKKERDGE